MVELREQQIGFEYVKEIPVYYQKTFLGKQPVRLISVEDKIVLATVAFQEISEAMKAQMRARLRKLNKQVGMIANFHGFDLDVVLVRGDYNNE